MSSLRIPSRAVDETYDVVGYTHAVLVGFVPFQKSAVSKVEVSTALAPFGIISKLILKL